MCIFACGQASLIPAAIVFRKRKSAPSEINGTTYQWNEHYFYFFFFENGITIVLKNVIKCYIKKKKKTIERQAKLENRKEMCLFHLQIRSVRLSF